MKRLWVFILVFLWSFYNLSLEAKILNPEEAETLLQHIVKQSKALDYWGIWRFKDAEGRKEHFVEVLFLKGVGLGWKVLGEGESFNIRLGNYRYVVNLESGEVESIYPLLDLPFAPLEEDVLGLLLENYLFDLRGSELTFVSKWTGKVIRSLLLDDSGEVVAQRMYSPQGEFLGSWEMLYRDTSPEYPWISRYLNLLASWNDKVRDAESQKAESLKIVLPSFVPPGFRLHRAYLLNDGERRFYGLVYTDGLVSFMLFQSAYPFKVSGSPTLRYIHMSLEKSRTKMVAEKEGFYFFLIGGLDPRVGREVLKSLTEEGGR
jgi:hypothetical protein